MNFKCNGCGKVLTGDAVDAGRVSDCPSCGREVKIPHPGIGIGSFWICWLLIKFVWALLAAGMGEGAILLLPVVIAFNLYVKYLRVINIGANSWWTLFGLVPFISTIWFGVTATGSAKSKIDIHGTRSRSVISGS